MTFSLLPLLLFWKRKLNSDIKERYYYLNIMDYYYLSIEYISLHSICYLHVLYFTEYKNISVSKDYI